MRMPVVLMAFILAVSATASVQTDEEKAARVPLEHYLHFRGLPPNLAGNAGVAKFILDYPNTRFVDYISLLKVDGEWKIVNKTFYAEPKK